MYHVLLGAFVSLAGATLALADEVPQGKSLYEARCAFCHGIAGAGDGVAGGALEPHPTDFTRPDYWKTATAERIRNAVTNGKPGTAMAPFGNSLGAAEIEALVEFVQSFAPRR